MILSAEKRGMNKILLMVTAFLVVACAHESFHNKVARVTPGMYPGDVEEILGSPVGFKTEGDLTVWQYLGRYSECYISFENHRVSAKNCVVHQEAEASAIAADTARDIARHESIQRNLTNRTSFGDALLQGQKRTGGGSDPHCIGLPPLSNIGCRPVCISGNWEQVCKGP
jgi:hypothetical protein